MSSGCAARAARRREDDGGRAALEGALVDARDLLADDRAHRPAHELEDEGADLHGLAVDGARSGLEGVARPRRAAGAAQPLAVALRVTERERVDAFNRRVLLDERARVEDQLEPARRRQREVVLALRADVVVLLEIGRQEGRAAAGTLREYPGGDAAFLLGRLVVSLFVSLVPGH